MMDELEETPVPETQEQEKGAAPVDEAADDAEVAEADIDETV